MIKFIGGFIKVQDLPKTSIKEYAFIGKSNVGKSSLINAIFGSKIARTSNTPGRTRELNVFNFNDIFFIVDLPGYGYAKVSKTEQLLWIKRLEEYLLNRKNLTRVFLLIDSRIGVKNSDLEVMNFCDINGIIYQIIYTKIDKKEKEQKKVISHINHPAMCEKIIYTSSKNKIGIEEIRNIIEYE